MFNADGQTYRQTHMRKLRIAFRNFANALKTCCDWLRLPLDFVNLHHNATSVLKGSNTALRFGDTTF
jgi:hypothetical protein